MTDKQYNVRCAELDVKSQKIRVEELRRKLEQTIREAQAQYEMKVTSAKAELDKARTELSRSESWLECRKAQLMRGFEV